MTAVVWDGTGQRKFEAGVDHGVLYLLNSESGEYDSGFAWNGLTTVKEQPGGAAPNPSYADNIKYLNLLSTETYSGTIEAWTYPDEWGVCDGTAAPVAGVVVGQQTRQTFGLCYRSKIGNDISSDAGFKLHLVYGALAAASERDFATINDNPSSVQFSWAFECSPVPMTNMKPTCQLTIDSTKVNAGALTDLMDLLYGTEGTDPSLPMPDDVLALFSGTVTVTAEPAVPTMTADVITIPAVTGVIYSIDGVDVDAGAQPAITQNTVVHARPAQGYIFPDPSVDEWFFQHT
ncbi:MAG TPA: hypothetical protein VGI71_23865 [Scandinavium sp.]|jgi:hypothetical protein